MGALTILQSAIAGGNILSSYLKTKKRNQSLNKAQATILSNIIGEGKTSARLQQMDMATETAMGGAMANAFAQGAASGVKNIAPYVASANAELLSNAMQNKTQYLAETDKLNAQLASQLAQLETQREDPISALLDGAMQGTIAALQLETMVGQNNAMNKIFKSGTGGIMEKMTKKANETNEPNLNLEKPAEHNPPENILADLLTYLGIKTAGQRKKQNRWYGDKEN